MAQLFFEGFFLQAGLIFALGAQNLYVLESGLRKKHCLAVSLTCFVCDLIIIMLGVTGVGVVLQGLPEVKIILGVLGIGFMLHYALKKLTVREEGGNALNPLDDKAGLRSSILKAITFSVINPHAYLDGIVLIGGYASKYSENYQRITVGLGAAIYSLVWFLMLSHASSSMKLLLNNGRKMRLAMTLSGVVLLVLSFRLSLNVYDWVVEAWTAEEALVSGNTN